jgi:hypothetical protein
MDRRNIKLEPKGRGRKKDGEKAALYIRIAHHWIDPTGSYWSREIPSSKR